MSHRAVLPPVGEPLPLRMPDVHRARLSSGLETLIVERRDLPVVDVQIVVQAGAAHDFAAHAGRAHLTADLLDEGTSSRQALQIAEEVEALGASLRTRASWDYAAASLHVLRPHVEAATALLADVLLQPAFDDAEFDRKQRERLHAIGQERDDPRNLASMAFTRLVYGSEHPFGLPIGGVAASVTALGAADLAAYHSARYGPSAAFAVVCGDIRTDVALDLLEHHFGAWRTAVTPAPPLPAAPAPRSRAIRIVDRPGAPQSEIRIGHAGPPRSSPDYVALHVANTILGGAFTSRLNILLREEKGYTYGAGSSFAFRRNGGPFVASTAVGTAATADAVNDMVSEVGRLVAEPVTANELARAQSYLVLGLPRTFETTGDVAEHVSELALYDLPHDYYEEYAAAVRRVTPAEVQAAAARWLRPEELVIVVAGDAAAVSDELASLGIGAVDEYDEDAC
ncbi:MAG TPA: pitrilysin family protein [Longimicrobiales bacterium]|nr:pitrilysin family protein [Longimicrobiales bacterium]